MLHELTSLLLTAQIRRNEDFTTQVRNNTSKKERNRKGECERNRCYTPLLALVSGATGGIRAAREEAVAVVELVLHTLLDKERKARKISTGEKVD